MRVATHRPDQYGELREIRDATIATTPDGFKMLVIRDPEAGFEFATPVDEIKRVAEIGRRDPLMYSVGEVAYPQIDVFIEWSEIRTALTMLGV